MRGREAGRARSAGTGAVCGQTSHLVLVVPLLALSAGVLLLLLQGAADSGRQVCVGSAGGPAPKPPSHARRRAIAQSGSAGRCAVRPHAQRTFSTVTSTTALRQQPSSADQWKPSSQGSASWTQHSSSSCQRQPDSQVCSCGQRAMHGRKRFSAVQCEAARKAAAAHGRQGSSRRQRCRSQAVGTRASLRAAPRVQATARVPPPTHRLVLRLWLVLHLHVDDRLAAAALVSAPPEALVAGLGLLDAALRGAGRRARGGGDARVRRARCGQAGWVGKGVQRRGARAGDLPGPPRASASPQSRPRGCRRTRSRRGCGGEDGRGVWGGGGRPLLLSGRYASSPACSDGIQPAAGAARRPAAQPPQRSCCHHPTWCRRGPMRAGSRTRCLRRCTGAVGAGGCARAGGCIRALQ